MKYLLLEPLGGLANRMRAIESAVNYSVTHKMKLIIVWEKNHFLNANFADCFNPIDGIKVIQLNYLGTSIMSKFKRRILNGVKKGLASFYTAKYIQDAEIEQLLYKEEFDLRKVGDELDKFTVIPKGIYIKCCYEFYPDHTGFIIEINKQAQQLANRILEVNKCDIGIHIRRTDHTDAINNSPLQLFIDKISNKLATFPHYKFYLSTDSAEVANQLSEHFKSCIITGISNRERHSEEGIKSALIDLHCLGSCNEIWGSDQSSFSDRAARINNVPLEILSLKNSTA